MSVEVSNLVKARELADAVLVDPSQTASLALQHVIDEFRSGAVTLTPPQIEDLKELIAAHEKNGMSPSSSPEIVKAGGKEITLDGSPAIEIQVQVNGQTVRAVLSDALFNKNRTNQNSYAEGLGGRLATREENIAVANALLEKEEQGNLNPAEAKLLQSYRDKWVRDSEGGLGVDGRRLYGAGDMGAFDDPDRGALIILPIAESKEEHQEISPHYPEAPPTDQPISAPTIIIPSGILKIENALGANFHGPDSWNQLGVKGVEIPDLANYPRLTLAFLDASFEYDPDIKRSEAGIFVVTAKAQSINSFQRLANKECQRTKKEPAFYGGDWRQSERFANAEPKAEEIHFVLKDITPNSVSKSFDEQKPLKKPGLLIAGARELAEAIGMQYMDSDERVYELYGRTKNIDSLGARAIVGSPKAKGALGYFDHEYDSACRRDVGLALAWNLKKIYR